VSSPILCAGDSVHALGDGRDWVHLTCSLGLGLVLATFDCRRSVLQHCVYIQDGPSLTEVVLEILDSGVGLLDKRHEAVVV
jgi:hypothetical protein